VSSSRPFLLKSRDEEILKAVHFYRYVTVADITRLFFSPSSRNYAGAILAQLSGGKDYTDRQYLYRFPLPHTTSGNTEKVYTLGAKGRDFLQSELGMEVDWYFRPSEVNTMSYQQCHHALTLTRFLIASVVFCRGRDDIRLAEVRTEYELRRLAPSVEIEEQKGQRKEKSRMRVVPDAWLDIELLKNGELDFRSPILLEIDRGTEYQQNFKRHVKARVAFIGENGGYRELFGTSLVTIAYLTTGSKERLNNMRQWTKDVLKETNRENYADLLRFCSLTMEEIEPARLFNAPSWYELQVDTPLRLLD
jgi:hypothetical protein